MTAINLLMPFQRLLTGQHSFLIALSGGLDSMVLLDSLEQWRRQQPNIQLRAIHVHHGLSSNADSWLQHCLQQCKQRNIPCLVSYVQIDQQSKQSVEALAREARYQAFSQALNPGECLLTAHHLDDQCETFLLALKRGSGPTGLAAMPESIVFHQGYLLRPLLTFSRQQLHDYANERALHWIEDESNQDDRYDRNFLRLQILPHLKQRWPHFPQVVARSASLCAEQQNLLNEFIDEQLKQLLDEKGTLAILPLAAMGKARCQAILRRWLAWHKQPMPTQAQLQQLWQHVALSRQDAQPELQLGEIVIRRFAGRLYMTPLFAMLKQVVCPWADLMLHLQLPDKLGYLSSVQPNVVTKELVSCQIRAPAIDEKVSVRFHASGYYHIVGRQYSRPIKKLWQELSVPPWQRSRTPLIFYNDILVAAVGCFVTLPGQVTAKTDSITIYWWQNE